MKLTTGYKKPVVLTDETNAAEVTSNNSYLLLAGGGTKALSTLQSKIQIIDLL